jgi:hypothetical protein
MGVKTYLKYAVAKLTGNKDEALRAVADLVFKGSIKQAMLLNFNLYAVNAKVLILNSVIAKKPFPTCGGQAYAHNERAQLL